MGGGGGNCMRGEGGGGERGGGGGEAGVNHGRQTFATMTSGADLLMFRRDTMVTEVLHSSEADERWCRGPCMRLRLPAVGGPGPGQAQ